MIWKLELEREVVQTVYSTSDEELTSEGSQKAKACEPDSSKSPWRKYTTYNYPAFVTSYVLPPIFGLPQKLDLHCDFKIILRKFISKCKKPSL